MSGEARESLLRLWGPVIPGVLAALSFAVAGPGRAAPPEAPEAAGPPGGEPDYSELWLSAGIRYNNNFSINPDRIEFTSSPVQELGVVAYDDRALWGSRFRSNGAIEIYTDLEDSGRDVQLLSASTGPVFELGESWRLHTAVGGEASWFGYEFYTGLGVAYFTLEREGSTLRQVELDVGVEAFGKEFGGDNVPWLDLYVDLAWDSLLWQDDELAARVFFEHYHADEASFRYSQVALTLGHDAPLAGQLSGAASLTGSRQWYYGSDPGVSGDRRDTTLTAIASFTWSGLFLEPLSAELRGLYERDWSNDDFQDYDGQSVVFYLHWRF
ncbi:MAG: hypothetical protein JRH16_18085 [Deltaproteobacteria bacterium]|nr:hypothetical protein [Deltaproteobacteria bacterium]MBW2361169.1 hypothetical protein [Deltaproteobacteria bacterium]